MSVTPMIASRMNFTHTKHVRNVTIALRIYLTLYPLTIKHCKSITFIYNIKHHNILIYKSNSHFNLHTWCRLLIYVLKLLLSLQLKSHLLNVNTIQLKSHLMNINTIQLKSHLLNANIYVRECL